MVPGSAWNWIAIRCEWKLSLRVSKEQASQIQQVSAQLEVNNRSANRSQQSLEAHPAPTKQLTTL
jgi:hypothetical protein